MIVIYYSCCTDIIIKMQLIITSAVASKPCEQLRTSPGEEEFATQSCYEALIRLGDLSRYLVTELRPGSKPDLSTAIGYYNLAATLLPQFGTAHNQLAALTVIDGDHLRAVYHLCLAATVEEPHENAIRNINYQ